MTKLAFTIVDLSGHSNQIGRPVQSASFLEEVMVSFFWYQEPNAKQTVNSGTDLGLFWSY